MPPLTRLLIVANGVIFGLEAISGHTFIANYALWPLGRFTVEHFDGQVGFQLWQLVTCGFLHANLVHLGVNMYALDVRL